MKKALKKCCNGCDAPPQHPSLVLCKTCLDALGDKIKKMAADLEKRALRGGER